MVFYILQWSPDYSKIFKNIETYKLVQIATLPDCIAFNLSNLLLFVFLIKANTYIKIIVLDIKTVFTKPKVRRLIKSFDKVLPRKHIDAIYNRQAKK